MLNWDVDVRTVRKFVTKMCKKTCLSPEQRQSIMVSPHAIFAFIQKCACSQFACTVCQEIVDSFAKSLLAPIEGSFDMMRRNTSSSGEDISQKVGLRKKSNAPEVVKQPTIEWSRVWRVGCQIKLKHPPNSHFYQSVLCDVIKELQTLTDEQASLMVQRARQREEQQKRKEKEEKKAAKKSIKEGKVDASSKNFEKKVLSLLFF